MAIPNIGIARVCKQKSQWSQWFRAYLSQCKCWKVALLFAVLVIFFYSKERTKEENVHKWIIFPKLHIEDMEDIDSPDEASVDLTQKRKAAKKCLAHNPWFDISFLFR